MLFYQLLPTKLLYFFPAFAITSYIFHKTCRALTLETLASHAFVANLHKCSFRKNRAAHLGHLILGQGVAVNPSKIKCIPLFSSSTYARPHKLLSEICQGLWEGGETLDRINQEEQFS
jgi:hypothetical protein